jgi:8-oxo-dGTP pyrophosphatase MutT (NUDIX family)
MSETWIAPAQMLARVAQRLSAALAPPSQAYLPLLVSGQNVGWITPERAQRLAAWPKIFRVTTERADVAPSLCTAAERTAALTTVARDLARENALTAWRDERYAVAPRADDPPLFELERAAARYFGIHTFAAHANGLVVDGTGWRMWIARRSPTKAIDPGLLDNLIGGGIAAGTTVAATLAKEAWEEAGIAAERVRGLQAAGVANIFRDQPDGLQHETIHVHDLWLPAGFVPANQDGEAVEHRLCSSDEVLALIATDEVTADASLVVVDFLLRSGHVAAGDPSRDVLERLRAPTISSPPAARRSRQPR